MKFTELKGLVYFYLIQDKRGFKFYIHKKKILVRLVTNWLPPSYNTFFLLNNLRIQKRQYKYGIFSHLTPYKTDFLLDSGQYALKIIE